MRVLCGARGDKTHFFLRLIVFGLSSSSFQRGICLRSLFATIIATRSPVTPLARRITKKHERSPIHTKRPTWEGAVCAPVLQCPVYGCCRRRHCYEGAFRDVTFDPKYKCKILLKSPDTGAPPVVPLLCHYTFIYIYIY